MRTLRLWLLVIAGIALPVVLALAVYLISSGFGASADVAPVPPGGKVVQTGSPGEGQGSGRGSDDQATTTPSSGPSSLDGRCSEPEHLNDPTCLSGNSGPGSGSPSSPDNSGEGSSGSGSSSSGHGGGDD
jgi:hypothetical protein